MNLRKTINPSPKQEQFLESLTAKRFVLYGGAMGGGKSYILRWAAVWYLIWLASKGIPKAQVGLFCEDYPSLVDRQISKMRFEFPAELGQLREGTTRDFVLADAYGGGRIALRNLDDPSKYQSAEFAGIAVDELTKNEQSVFDFLRMRLRWPGVERPRFWAGTNPGGKGHAWVKKLWLDGKFPVELKALAPEFAYVQAVAADNPHLTQSYYDDLATLPPSLRKPYLEGDWNIFKGQYFTIFDPRKQVVKRPEAQAWYPRWASMDWGFEHKTAVYWHMTDENSRHVTYREFVTSHTSPKALAAEIVEANNGEKLQQFYLSPDAFAHVSSESSIAEQMGEVFKLNGLPFPAPANNDRIGGWQLMYELLDNGTWSISEDCPHLIECLPTLVRDEKRPEDIAKMTGDDPADGARYGIYSHLPKGRKPLEQIVAETLVAANPALLAVREAQVRHDHKSEHRPVRLFRPRYAPRWRQ